MPCLFILGIPRGLVVQEACNGDQLLKAMVFEVGASVLGTCAHFISLVDEFQCAVFLCQFGTDTQAHPLCINVAAGHR